MLDIKKVDDIYKRYGYDVADENGIRVYKYTQGRYFGIDIFDYNKTKQSEEIKNAYSRLGYAVLIRDYTSIEEVELELFKSFFNASHFKSLVDYRYDDFTRRQMIAMPESSNYEYVKCAYSSMKYDEEGFPVFENSQIGDSVVEQVTNLIFATTTVP